MKYFLILLIAVIMPGCIAQVPAFPGAEGGGKYCTGGRGGKILFVENLNDKGKGSFRHAIEDDGPRIIVFRVSGTIELNKLLHIKNGDLTIAGQTAPGEGICLKNYGIRVDADNVIIRYIRVRPGDEIQEENDAIYGLRNKNTMIDHCSFSWGMDEVASFYDNENFSMQWCIISESLYNSFHHKGPHGYGGIWGGLNASFHHNLISDHSSRNPRFCGSRYSDDPEREKTDFRNNVIYNWGHNSIYGGEAGSYNVVNNYFKPGPATKGNKQYRILDLTQVFYTPRINRDTLYAGKFYIDGNEVEGYPEIAKDNWDRGVQGSDVDESSKNKSRLEEPIPHSPVKTTKAKTAYEEVLKHAGANLHRDEIDQRIIVEVRTGTESYGVSFKGGKNGIIDSPGDVGGWPVLKSLSPPSDSDNDGMPDQWEMKHKLDPKKADASQHVLDEDYTNIEVYINSLVNDNG